jgi:enterochelin esterase family protein
MKPPVGPGNPVESRGRLASSCVRFFTMNFSPALSVSCRWKAFRRRLALHCFAALAGLSLTAAPTDNVYRLGPDSLPQEGVPQGKVIGPLTLPSRVFTNTTRHYWVYVPAQYDPKTPAALMIFQDGHAFVNTNGDYRIPFVFDNLIHRREMPVTLGVFINPGHTPEQKESSSADWGDRINNRPTEYNELNDNYAKLIVDELLPALKRDYNLSDNPEDRAIAGASSGAICAWTVAWHRPDQFRKVISTIGSFTNIRGGHRYPEMVRQTDRKPIRIFLQDGLNDNRGKRRDGTYDPQWDWHTQNRLMVEALTARGYDVNYCWGIGTHSNKQGGAMMPEMLRWLWRDYPRPDNPQDEGNRGLRGPITAAPEKP